MRNIILFVVLLLTGCQAEPEQKAANDETTTDSIIVVAPVQTPPLPVLNQLDYDTTQWTDLALLDSSILLDLRYATENNFVQEKMYDCARCFFRPEAARAVVAVHRELQRQGLALKMLDCYRPRPVQWKLWEKVPDRRYVADPRKGSMHNRGAAADLTLADSTGRELEMGTPYDFFGPEAYPSYTALPDSVLANRALLRLRRILLPR